MPSCCIAHGVQCCTCGSKSALSRQHSSLSLGHAAAPTAKYSHGCIWTLPDQGRTRARAWAAASIATFWHCISFASNFLACALAASAASRSALRLFLRSCMAHIISLLSSLWHLSLMSRPTFCCQIFCQTLERSRCVVGLMRGVSLTLLALCSF